MTFEEYWASTAQGKTPENMMSMVEESTHFACKKSAEAAWNAAVAQFRDGQSPQ